MNSQPYRRFEDLMGLEILPDGAIKFYEANDEKLSFTLQINDLRIHEYHRNNGITKITYKSKEGGQSYPVIIKIQKYIFFHFYYYKYLLQISN